MITKVVSESKVEVTVDAHGRPADEAEIGMQLIRKRTSYYC